MTPRRWIAVGLVLVLVVTFGWIAVGESSDVAPAAPVSD